MKEFGCVHLALGAFYHFLLPARSWGWVDVHWCGVCLLPRTGGVCALGRVNVLLPHQLSRVSWGDLGIVSAFEDSADAM